MFFMFLFCDIILVILHMFDLSTWWASDEGALTTKTIFILDNNIQELRCQKIDQVKV
jgi:hypothetical protein